MWLSKGHQHMTYQLYTALEVHPCVHLTNLENFLFNFDVDWLVDWVYGISTMVGYLMPNPFLYKSVLFQTIQFSVSTVSMLKSSISNNPV